MDIVKQEFKVVRVAELNPHPDNPQVGNEEEIASSIRENGYFGYVVVQKSTNIVIAGWHSCKQAAEAGIEEVPAIVIDCDDEQAARILLVDNRSASRMRGSVRQDKLIENLAMIASGKGSLIGTGYSSEFFEGLKSKLAPPPPPDDLEVGKERSQAAAGFKKMAVGVAMLTCLVNSSDYQAWEAKIKAQCGFDRKRVVEEIKKRLQF